MMATSIYTAERFLNIDSYDKKTITFPDKERLLKIVMRLLAKALLSNR